MKNGHPRTRNINKTADFVNLKQNPLFFARQKNFVNHVHVVQNIKGVLGLGIAPNPSPVLVNRGGVESSPHTQGCFQPLSAHAVFCLVIPAHARMLLACKNEVKRVKQRNENESLKQQRHF
ncbi:MAG: hypothetical protein LBE35_09385 [Clostridiales bacterium]|jgi:hypothetical protein|nr:hypothetical protein [Clostridiales bacterium]